MRYGSVCSGIEAATAAWHPLGWEPAFFSEIDPFPRAVLAHHYPNVPLHGDFTTIQRGDYADIDVLVGGTPCQSFSVAGLRKGLSDPRGNLMLGFGALAERLRPEWLVWENVPGVLSSNGGRDFGSFLGMLGELGYGFAYRVLDAQYFGVAQRRRRVFVVGHAGDWRRAAAVLFERDSLSGNPAPRREAGKAAPTIPSRSTAGGGLGTDFDCDGGLIPQTVGALTDGAHMGGGTTDRTPTPAGYLPSLSLCLNAGAMGRQDADQGYLIPVEVAGVPIAFDAYNQVETGDVSKTLTSRNDIATGSVVAVASTLHGDKTVNTASQTGGPAAFQEAADCLLASYGRSWNGNSAVTSGSLLVAHPTGDVAHSLRGAGFDASEDGTGRGTPRVPVHAFVPAVAPCMTSNYGKQPDSSDTSAGPMLVAHAFDARQSDVVQYGDMTGPLDTDGHSVAVAIGTDCYNGLITGDVAATMGTSGSSPTVGPTVMVPRPLAAGAHPPAIAIQDVRAVEKQQNGRGWNDDGTSYAVDTYATQGVASGMMVRRLTVRECERLQGFPDNFTAIPYRGKPASQCPDGPRYKALGNSMAVPVMAWIGRRIAALQA